MFHVSAVQAQKIDRVKGFVDNVIDFFILLSKINKKRINFVFTLITRVSIAN